MNHPWSVRNNEEEQELEPKTKKVELTKIIVPLQCESSRLLVESGSPSRLSPSAIFG